jgi:hypothetical protein
MPVGRPGRGPHFAGSQSGAVIVVLVVGGSRHADTSHFSPAAHDESSLQTPRAGRQAHGPMQLSTPAQTSSSPAWQFGYVQPQRATASGGTVPSALTTLSHGHW